MWLHSVVHFVLSFICCFCILLSCNSADCHRERVFIPVIYRPFFLLMKGLKNDFVRNILWTFEDIHMLVGSNMPIFGGGRYPAVSLRLRWILKLTSLYVPALAEFCFALLSSLTVCWSFDWFLTLTRSLKKKIHALDLNVNGVTKCW